MRIAANLGPTDDALAILAAAQTAESLGLDAVGLLDHYHAPRPTWRYLCGWSLYGAIAMRTMRIRLVPLVLDSRSYLPGILARESAVLAILSRGRFELSLGAGDFFAEAQAWGVPVPSGPARITALRETVLALRRVWTGEPVSVTGQVVTLTGAVAAAVPPAAPRVVVGVGRSRALIRSAVHYADELNVYADEAVLRYAREQIERAEREVALSVYVWDWPADIDGRLARWAQLGVTRTFLTVWHPFTALEQAATLLG